MGYYTRFEINQETDYLSNIEQRFEEVTQYNYSSLFEDGNSVKWYDYEKDMKKLSEEYPKHTFILKGYGEESEDMWIHYFKRGKSKKYEAEIKFPKLKDEELKY